ncbi:MAG: 50S ribosomal protein L32 [Ignavibacteria bacterium]|nr:50S ribosomal protein L32 [Ignavibacteria bacterium]MBT8392403.1 50S ribosomal protein L32 [Ignavibacteria bacterium]NNJ52652.1 50S ribosomal protein L32 [Ignavibacteriaceae bacterium]NNL22173.1 50S ribosomal protein L32 [Ignavibacteriaceae bacterium]
MPHPKRKISKSRRDKRRTHYKATAPSLGGCPNCGEMKLTHRACPSCGYYGGRSMFIPKS